MCVDQGPPPQDKIPEDTLTVRLTINELVTIQHEHVWRHLPGVLVNAIGKALLDAVILGHNKLEDS